MNEAIQQLNFIKANLERLLRGYNAIKNENEILKNQIDAQRKSMAEKNAKITEIEQQLSDVKAIQSISRQINADSESGDMQTPENKSEVKQKINALITEVDKCIALLNN